MVKVLLVEPPAPNYKGVMRILASLGTNKMNWKFPPLDLMGIGGLLRNNNIESFEILDALNLGLKWSQVKNEIAKKEPELVAFTFTVPTVKNEMLTAQICSEVSENIKTVAVNIAAESYPYDGGLGIMRDYPHVDFLAYRDPEHAILDLTQNNFNPHITRGIYYRHYKTIYRNIGGTLRNLDEIYPLTHDKIPIKIYRSPYQKRRPMSATSFTRGCINQRPQKIFCGNKFLKVDGRGSPCKHCIGGNYLSPLRLLSVDKAIEELKFCESLGIRELRFFDGELTADMDWAEKVFEKWIEEEIDITFSANVRGDCVRKSLLEKMKKAGCHTVSIGLDSAEQSVLDSMGKHETVKQILNAIKLIKEVGLKFTTYTTFGLPRETKYSMKKTIKLINELKPEMASFAIAVPVCGTEFYDYLERNGFLNKNVSIERYDPNYPPVYSYPWLSSEEMYEIVMKAYREYYGNLKYVLHRLFKGNLINNIKYGLFFVRRYIFESWRVRQK